MYAFRETPRELPRGPAVGTSIPTLVVEMLDAVRGADEPTLLKNAEGVSNDICCLIHRVQVQYHKMHNSKSTMAPTTTLSLIHI